MATGKITARLLILTLVAGVILAAVGCGGSITGSTIIETREMDFAGFTELEVSNAFEVDISRGDVYFVSITANDNLFQHLDIHQSGKTLYIGLKQPRIYFNSTQKAAIVMPDLDSLDLSGASSGDVRGFSFSHPAEFDLSGASSLYILDMAAGDTEFDISGASGVSGSMTIADGEFNLSGASTIELEGSADDVSIEASGASHVRLADFPVTNAEVNLSGASSAVIDASGDLSGDLSGASRLSYIGSPTLGSITVSGGSEIRRQ